MMQNKVLKIIRRPFLLLELMLAFALVSLSLLPLIAPHFFIYQEQRRFIDKIELDIALNKFYAMVEEQLQRNEIPWAQVEDKQHLPVDDSFWRKLGYDYALPFTGEYWFEIQKAKKNERYGLYLVRLNVEFIPRAKKKEAPLAYHYDFFVSRLFQSVPVPAANEPLKIEGATP